MPTTTAAVEPVAWDPHQQINPDTPLSALPVLGLAVSTAGLDPLAPIIGLQTTSGADVRASLFKPDQPLPTDGQAARSLALSHVTEADLAHGRSWPIIRPRLVAYLELQVGAVVTHNGSYHLGVLAARHVPPPPTIDTMRLALFLDLTARLDRLAYALQVPLADRGPSTGGADATTPVRVWTALVPRLTQRGVKTWGDMLRLEVSRATDRPAWPDLVRAAWRRGVRRGRKAAPGEGVPGRGAGSRKSAA